MSDLQRTRPVAERLLPLAIAALGLAAAYGTQRYLEGFLTFWPSVLAAGAIETAYITLALLRTDDVTREKALGTARVLVYASVAYNFGHAYNTAVPGGLATETARWDALAFLQAIGIAAFVPAIALRLAQVQSAIAESKDNEQSAADAQTRDLEQVQSALRGALDRAAAAEDKVLHLNAAVQAAEQNAADALRTAQQAQLEAAARPARRGAALPAARPQIAPAGKSEI